MWKAEKIELVKYVNYYREEKLRLEINDAIIIDNAKVRAAYMTERGWQCCPCNMCDEEYCSYGSFLQLRKQDNKLFFTPFFDSIDNFEQYDYDKYEGEQDCAPDEWYERGILVLENDMVKQLIELLPVLSLDSVKELSKQETDKIIDWEECVRIQPTKGFSVIKEKKINEAV